MQQITYQKRNGDILQRYRVTGLPYRIGEYTSMGWLVLDIRYSYKGKYYPRSEYDNLLDRDLRRDKKIRQIKNAIKRIYFDMSYFMILLIFLRVFELLSK